MKERRVKLKISSEHETEHKNVFGFKIKPEYFQQIESRTKTKEVWLRKNDAPSGVRADDIVIFETGLGGKIHTCKCRVTNFRLHRGIDSVLTEEDMSAVLPEFSINYKTRLELARKTFKGEDLHEAEFEVWDLEVVETPPAAKK